MAVADGAHGDARLHPLLAGHLLQVTLVVAEDAIRRLEDALHRAKGEVRLVDGHLLLLLLLLVFFLLTSRSHHLLLHLNEDVNVGGGAQPEAVLRAAKDVELAGEAVSLEDGLHAADQRLAAANVRPAEQEVLLEVGLRRGDVRQRQTAEEDVEFGRLLLFRLLRLLRSCSNRGVLTSFTWKSSSTNRSWTAWTWNARLLRWLRRIQWNRWYHHNFFFSLSVRDNLHRLRVDDVAIFRVEQRVLVQSLQALLVLIGV